MSKFTKEKAKETFKEIFGTHDCLICETELEFQGRDEDFSPKDMDKTMKELLGEKKFREYKKAREISEQKGGIPIKRYPDEYYYCPFCDKELVYCPDFRIWYDGYISNETFIGSDDLGLSPFYES